MKWLWGTREDWRGVGLSAFNTVLWLALVCIEGAFAAPYQDQITSPMVLAAMLVDVPVALWISAVLRKRRG